MAIKGEKRSAKRSVLMLAQDSLKRVRKGLNRGREDNTYRSDLISLCKEQKEHIESNQIKLKSIKEKIEKRKKEKSEDYKLNEKEEEKKEDNKPLADLLAKKEAEKELDEDRKNDPDVTDEDDIPLSILYAKHDNVAVKKKAKIRKNDPDKTMINEEDSDISAFTNESSQTITGNDDKIQSVFYGDAYTIWQKKSLKSEYDKMIRKPKKAVANLLLHKKQGKDKDKLLLKLKKQEQKKAVPSTHYEQIKKKQEQKKAVPSTYYEQIKNMQEQNGKSPEETYTKELTSRPISKQNSNKGKAAIKLAKTYLRKGCIIQ
ncbi:MAG: hypothetical protein K5769_04940 [Pseudobutyrivibrio sp.]|nr:hypothetical protein [Pseudobutyrivibrio sp.]